MIISWLIFTVYETVLCFVHTHSHTHVYLSDTHILHVLHSNPVLQVLLLFAGRDEEADREPKELANCIQWQVL